MAQQNINQYNFKKWFIKSVPKNNDLSLASDEVDFNQEVVFSTELIGLNDGNRLPIHFDLNNSGSSQLFTINYGDYYTGNTLVSLNYYNPNNDNLNCYTSSTLCDIGLTGVDNGLTTQISGETLYYTMGLYTGDTKWDRYHYDRRMKLIPVSYGTNELVDLVLTSDISAGSVIVNYVFSASTNVKTNVSISFTQSIGRTDNTPLVVTTGVTIFSGTSTGSTTVVFDASFSNLNQTSSFENVTISGVKYTQPIVLKEDTKFEVPVCEQFLTDELSNILTTENSDNIITELDGCYNCYSGLQTLNVGYRTGPIVYNSVDNTIYVAAVENPYVFIIDPLNFIVSDTVTLSQSSSFYNYMTYYSGTNSVYGSYVFSDNTIGVVSSNTEDSTLSIFVPRGLTVQPNEERLYVGGTGRVRYVDLNTLTTHTGVSLGSASFESVYNSVDNTIYFAKYIAGQVAVYDCSTSNVTTNITVGKTPYNLQFNPLLNVVYVLNEGDDSVSVIDCNTNTVIATITGMTNVLSILYIPNTTKLLVSNLNGVVYKINCSNNTITCSQDLGTNIPQMTYNPNDGLVYVSDYNETTTIRRFIP
jgi:YVTN family beta-propeller protein